MENENKLRKSGIIIVMILLVMCCIFVIYQFAREEEKTESEEIGEIVGYLSIDKLGLYDVEVRNDVNSATLRKAIGKYANIGNTDRRYNGNVCLFSYSSGQERSYFYNINQLRVGDEIIYKTGNETRKYAVYAFDMLPAVEQSFLETSEENKITLVTNITKTNMNLIVRSQECSTNER